MIKKKFYKKILCTLLFSSVLAGTINHGADAMTSDYETDTLKINKLSGFFTGSTSEDGGAAEIVKFNKDNNKFYVINGVSSKLHIVSIDGIENSNNSLEADKTIDVKPYVEDAEFQYGDITSVAINNTRKEVAISVQEKNYNKDGKIVLLDYDGNLKEVYSCGVQPDMITYTPDSNYILTANEGEPRNGYGSTAPDPQGSVTLLNLNDKTSKLVTFEKFDAIRDSLINDKVLLKKDSLPSEDLEPEYITVDSESKTAYVSLQEANAIATLDLASGEFTSVKGLGFKDHALPGNEVDALKDGSINIKNENLLGTYMPDSITVYETDGKTYILTANEGDAREYTTEEFDHIAEENQYSNLKKIKIDGKSVETLDAASIDGLDPDKNYLYGGRSFSIWDASTLTLVYDSGSDFEKITAERFPEFFNCSNKNTKLDDRSGKKGPEPEEVRLGVIGDKTYAFIGIERIGGFMVYDVTSPQTPTFVNYTNTRDFSGDYLGDSGPESIEFIPAEISKTGYPLLLVSNEISGTVSILQVQDGYVKPQEQLDKEAAEAVISMINGLPAEITLDFKATIHSIRQTYENLTASQKLLVTNLSNLEAAENIIASLESIEAERENDKNAALAVEELINQIPDNLTLQDKEKVTKAKEAYESLTASQKTLVNNFDKLTKAEELIAKLEADKNPSMPTPPSTEDSKDESDKKPLPQTGAAPNPLPLTLGVMAVASGILLKKYKK